MKGTGIIGCGVIAQVHGAAMEELGLNIAACCDILPERAQAFGERFGCRTYTDYKELLDKEELAAVHICLPHYLHAPVAVEALKRGIPVLSEKPIALNGTQGEEMCAAAREYKTPLGVIYQNRFNDSSVFAKACVEEGKLGKLLYARCQVLWKRDAFYYASDVWRGRWATEGGGVCINQAIHTIDLMRWLLGKPVKAQAMIGNHSIPEVEVEDSAQGVVYFENGVKAVFHLTNAYGEDRPPEVEIVGEKGRLLLQGSKAWLYDEKGVHENPVLDEPVAAPAGKPCYGTGHVRQIARFYQGLETGVLPVTGEDALLTQKMLDMIYASAKNA